MTNRTALIVLTITMAVVAVTFDHALTKSVQIDNKVLALQTVTR